MPAMMIPVVGMTTNWVNPDRQFEPGSSNFDTGRNICVYCVAGEYLPAGTLVSFNSEHVALFDSDGSWIVIESARAGQYLWVRSATKFGDASGAASGSSVFFSNIQGQPTDNAALAEALVTLPENTPLEASDGTALIGKDAANIVNVGGDGGSVVLHDAAYLGSQASGNALVTQGSIQTLRDDVTQIQGQIESVSQRFSFSFSSASVTTPASQLTDYIETTYGITVSPGMSAHNQDDGHLWVFYTSTGWEDDGLDTVGIATTSSVGVVKGGGDVSISPTGVMGVPELATVSSGVAANLNEINSIKQVIPLESDASGAYALASANPGRWILVTA